MTDGGRSAYRGYEYQISVTAWLALDLILERARCQAITIESASDEDVALELDTDPELAASVLRFDAAVPVEIQIKLRSQMLSVADFNGLVFEIPKKKQRGPAPKAAVSERLEQAGSQRYTLITSSQVHRDLKTFCVAQVGDLSTATKFKSHDPRLLARVGIMAEWTLPLVTHEIEELLANTARVPLQAVSACREALIEKVRARLLGRLDAVFPRTELLSILERFGGNPPQPADQFVAPNNYDLIAERLSASPHAVIIAGSPGLGKTFLAEHLASSHQQQQPAFRVLKDPSVADVRDDLRKPGRTLFYLEDPWGRYRTTEAGQTWTDELPKLIQAAQSHPDKRFLITSRNSVLAESLGQPHTSHAIKLEQQLVRFVVQLRSDNYGPRERREILKRWMVGSFRWQRDWLERVEEEVVRDLASPQELSSFASHLRAMPAGSEPSLSDLIQASQAEAVSGVVATLVRNSNSVAAAIVLWTFLGTAEPIDKEAATNLSIDLQGDGEADLDLVRLISLLEQNGWLYAYDQKLSAHPRVIEGLESVLTTDPVTTRRVLPRLLAHLVSTGRTELAARLLRGLKHRRIAVSSEVQAAVDDYLKQQLLGCTDNEFTKTAQLATEVASDRQHFFRLVRHLAFVGHKKSPPIPGDVLEELKNDADAQTFLRRWVKIGLRRGPAWADELDLTTLVRSLGWDLREEFVSAAIEALDNDSYSEVALAAALAEAGPPFERLLQAAIEAYDRAEAWFEETGLKQQRAAEEGEEDALYSGYLIDQPSDHFFVAENAFDHIVHARRQRDGYTWIMSFTRRELLVEAWSKSITKEDTGDDELRALLNAAVGWKRRYALEAIRRCDATQFLMEIASYLVNESTEAVRYDWSAVIELCAPADLPTTVIPMLREVTPARRTWLVYELMANNMSEVHEEAVAEARAAILHALSRAERNAIALCLRWSREDDFKAFPLSEATRTALLHLIEAPDDDAAAIASVVYARHTRSAPPRLETLLKSESVRARLAALRASSLAEPALRERYLEALSDQSFRLRRAAMYLLSGEATPEEQKAILAKADDASAPVREACVHIIATNHWQEGLNTLLHALSDKRDIEQASIRSPDDVNPHLHVARAAAEALEEMTPLPAAALESVIKFVTDEASSDAVVLMKLIEVVALHEHPAIAGFFRRLLVSKRRAGGSKGTFPLRYASAWGWLLHLQKFPSDAPSIPAADFAKASLHSDERLSGPALIVLGVLANRGGSDLVQCWDELQESERKQELLYIAMLLSNNHAEAARFAPGSAGRVLIDLLVNPNATIDEWNDVLEKSASTATWLGDIKKAGALNSCLRFLITEAPNAEFASVKIDDLRETEIPRGIPMLSAFNLAGLE